MRSFLITGFIVLAGPQTLWATGPGGSLSSTVISGYVDTSACWSPKDLQPIPYSNRNLTNICQSPVSSSQDHFIQEDINQAQANLNNDLQFFSGPSYRLPNNLDDQTKDYLSHVPQDTRQMITKLDTLKTNPYDFYVGYNYSGLINQRSWNLSPQELPKHSDFTSQEQIWEKKNIPFGHLGISEMNHQWRYGLSTYYKDNWEWHPSYGLGESYGMNGPILVYGKTLKGPDIDIYSPDGNFVGDITKPKLNADPYAFAKYLIMADNPGIFGRSSSYDRSFPAADFNPTEVVIFPSGRSFADDFQTARIWGNRFEYYEAYYDEDCEDDEYYYDHEDECEDYYDGCIPSYHIERVFPRSILDSKDPNDPFYPNPKPKKKSGGGFLSGLIGAIAPTGPITVGDSSSSEGVNVVDQYSLPQIGYTDKSDPHSAWNAVDTKGPNVIVAVIDSGLDLTHPDGPEFIWTNPVDGTHGWNFIDDNSDVKDQRGHGTMVAGIIAARTNNGIGIAGINPGAMIMPLKVADKNGNANSLNIYRAIHFAVDHGARVINISLGALGVSELENLAINYARAHHVLVVIASGNSRNDIGISGPSSSGSAIAVGALNYDGTLATVSNWGANNSLMAPGEQIFSLHSRDARWDGPAGQKERLYTKESGTSFSAPMVTATASLLLVKDPDLTVDQLEDILLSTAKPLDKDRWNGLTGAGLLDAATALRADPKGTFNVKITKVKAEYKYKNLDYVDVYATVRGAVDYFTVEVGRGKQARGFRPVMGISGQQANDDLVAHIPENQLRGSNDWILLVRAIDKSGKEYLAHTALTIK